MNFNNIIDEKELLELQNQYPNLDIFDYTLDITEETFDYWFDILVTRQCKRGEVVLVMENPEKKILLHTKEFYPEGIYRLLSGGIHPNENVLVAVNREVYEETSLAFQIKDMLGIIKMLFRYKDRTLPFVSYVFHLTYYDGEPKVIDPNENITDFRVIPFYEIVTIAKNLRSLSGRRKDWGTFRALAHELVAEKLIKF